MKHLFTTLAIILMIAGCQQEESIIESEPDYESLLNQVEEIRGQNGYITIDLIHSSYDISKIDFSNHFVLNNLGIDGLEIFKKENNLELILQSDLKRFHQSKINIVSAIGGFEAKMTLANGEVFELNQFIDNSKDKFRHIKESGRIESFSQLTEELEKNYYSELDILYRVSSSVLFAVRELYFVYLVKQMPPSYFQVDEVDSDLNGRTSDLPSYCEVFPSVYLDHFGYSNFWSNYQLTGRLNAECSNQYCIGCCATHIEPECLFGSNTMCIQRGFGWICEGFPSSGGGNGNNDCSPNTPCPI